MVAGGGASVVYADTISDLGFGPELANYGEYSGAPTLQETYDYARTIFTLMCRHKGTTTFRMTLGFQPLVNNLL